MKGKLDRRTPIKMITCVHKLCTNPAWHPALPKPAVSVICQRNFDALSFIFDVTEPESCFRQQCQADGDPCWQDSCVEVFIQAPALKGYFNFETNALGKTLAEFGSCRQNRIPFTSEQYHALRRDILILPQKQPDGQIHWSVQISLPTELIRLGEFEPAVGNLYKCATNAENPQYLCAFKVDTPKPDFHRPEFFKNMFL